MASEEEPQGAKGEYPDDAFYFDGFRSPIPTPCTAPQESSERWDQSERWERSSGSSSPRPKRRPSVSSVQGAFHWADMFQTVQSKEEMAISPLRAKAQRLVKNPRFDMFVGFLVILNALLVGLEQANRLSFHEEQSDLNETYADLEHVFLSVFICELLLRLFAFGVSQLFKDPWLLFDALIILISVTSTWAMQPGSADSFGPVVIARVARVARLARQLRLLVLFSELWLLIQGLFASAKTMLYTLMLISGLLYAFALLAVDIITIPTAASDDIPPEIQELVDMYFSNVPLTMLTLVQFITFDSIGHIYRPLVIHDWKLAFYFIFVIIVLGVVVMNLVTAVIVKGAFDRAEEDKDMQEHQKRKREKKLIALLRDAFKRVDKDGSGKLDIRELLSASEQDRTLFLELTHQCDPIKLFYHLDLDNTGEIDLDEFLDGISACANENTPAQMQGMAKTVDKLRQELGVLLKQRDHVEDVLNDCASMIRRLERRMVPPRLKRTGHADRDSLWSTATAPSFPALTSARTLGNGLGALELPDAVVTPSPENIVKPQPYVDEAPILSSREATQLQSSDNGVYCHMCGQPEALPRRVSRI